MGKVKLMNNDWKQRVINEWVAENTYLVEKRVYWFKVSSASGRIIWPLQKVWLKGLRLPGSWQKDREEWITQSEMTFLILKGETVDL